MKKERRGKIECDRTGHCLSYFIRRKIKEKTRWAQSVKLELINKLLGKEVSMWEAICVVDWTWSYS